MDLIKTLVYERDMGYPRWGTRCVEMRDIGNSVL
jgi:hypothetical protein